MAEKTKHPCSEHHRNAASHYEAATHHDHKAALVLTGILSASTFEDWAIDRRPPYAGSIKIHGTWEQPTHPIDDSSPWGTAR